ncbi:DNA-binding protein [Comamonas antarctica]|uniref:DNA-binding protein n=1 Tax=Comamonas antarctica TaxID=2743470 RepID=UPI0028E734D4|nr:DNA-binding protein [Comamonas antarctica]
MTHFKYPPLEQVSSPNVDTAQAAHYLNRSPQTLRIWACKQTGAVVPARINGRLAWPVETIRKVVGGGS